MTTYLRDNMCITKSLPAACLPVGRAGKRHQFHHPLKILLPQIIDLTGFTFKMRFEFLSYL